MLHGFQHLPLSLHLIIVEPQLVVESGVLRGLGKWNLLRRPILKQTKCRRVVYSWMCVSVCDRRAIVGLDLHAGSACMPTGEWGVFEERTVFT